MKSKLRIRLLDILFVILAIAGSLRLLYRGSHNGEDFAVYWRAAQAWFAGISPYFYTKAANGFVFKYPPWILPLFTPFGFLDFEISRSFWALIQLGCLYVSVLSLIRCGIRARVAVGVAFAFWWMWLAHFEAGQFTIILLGAAFWGLSNSRLPWLFYLFSSKIFSLVSFVPLIPRFLNRRVAFYSALIIVGGTLISIGVFEWRAQISSFSRAASQLVEGFRAASSSGGAELGEKIVRGQGNHGFTAAVLRTLQVSSTSFSYDIAVWAILSLLLGSLWHHFSRSLDFNEKWVGWLALGVIVHPLAWHHSFVLAYPLCAFAWDRAILTRNRKLIFAAVLGTACIGVLIPQVIGQTLVKPLELASIKSWGVVLSAVTLVLSRRNIYGKKAA